MTNDVFTRWDGVPFSDDVTLTVMLRSGKTITAKACDLDWSEDIVAYKILEKITPQDFGAADPKGHPNASILMEIAKEAAVNEEYWKEFEIKAHDGCWYPLDGADISLGNFIDNPIRRKPRTIRIGEYDVPEPSGAWINPFIKGDGVVVDLKFKTNDEAELMLKALQELLGAKKC